MNAAPLPELDVLDQEALKAIIFAQQDALEVREQKLSSSQSEIAHLKLLVEKLRHMLFGAKSEKVLRQIDQLELRLEELESAGAAERTRSQRKTDATRPSRRPLPEHLPREVHTHMPEHESCPDCGSALRRLGEDVAEVLEYVPASFKVIRHVRPRMSCSACDRILQAAAPSRPIESRTGRPRSAGACARLQVRSSTTLSSGRNLYPRRRGPRSLDTRRMGGRGQ